MIIYSIFALFAGIMYANLGSNNTLKNLGVLFIIVGSIGLFGTLANKAIDGYERGNDNRERLEAHAE